MRLYLATIIITGVTLLLGGCPSQPQSCITPPPVKSDLDKSVAVDVSAKLEKLQISGDLKTEFKNLLKTDFDKLSDSNASYYLFLQAIDCYLQRGKVGEDIAKDMAQMVRAKWAATNNLAGTNPSLSEAEKNLIKKSPDVADTIFRDLNKFGIR